MRWDFVNETKVPPRASNEPNLVRSSSLIASLYEGMNEDEEKKEGTREEKNRERALLRVTHRLSNRRRRPSRT